MSHFYDTDIDVFFSDFAEDVVWTDVATLPANNVTHTISAVVDMPGSVQRINDVPVITTDIIAAVKTTDVTGITRSDTNTIDGTAYKIINILPDGTGITKITLAIGVR